MSAFAEQWGRPLERDGYTQITNRLLRGKYWRQLLLEREARIILRIISYQDDPEYRTIPSAKQLAFDAGVSYNQTRNLLKRLTNPVIDADGVTLRSTLLIPIICAHGRIRYSMTPLKYELERLEKFPEVVKPKPRPAPKPEPIPEPEPLPAAEDEELPVEDSHTAREEWDRIRVAMARNRTKGELHWLEAANGVGWREDTLVVASNDWNTIKQLKRPSWVLEAEGCLHQRWPDYAISFEYWPRRRFGVVGLAVAALAFGGV